MSGKRISFSDRRSRKTSRRGGKKENEKNKTKYSICKGAGGPVLNQETERSKGREKGGDIRKRKYGGGGVMRQLILGAHNTQEPKLRRGGQKGRVISNGRSSRAERRMKLEKPRAGSLMSERQVLECDSQRESLRNHERGGRLDFKKSSATGKMKGK